MTTAPSLSEQATEVELCALGHADFVRRADAREFKRTPEEIERRRIRMAHCQAAAQTLRRLEASGS